MGLYDRDYMRRPPDDEPGRDGAESAGGKLEEVFGNFLRKHPRLPAVVIATLVALSVLALLVFKLASSAR